jgi:hypothetical protein
MGVLATAAAAVLVAALGCSSSPKHEPPKASSAPDELESNQLMLRMALAENVYNGMAAERAVYPKDFNPDTATLTELGNQRVATLLQSCRGAKGRVTIIRGDELEDVYTARVTAVRQRFADAGFALQDVAVAKGDHVGGGGISSGQAILIFDRMLTDYNPAPVGGSGAASNASAMPQGTTSSGGESTTYK